MMILVAGLSIIVLARMPVGLEGCSCSALGFPMRKLHAIVDNII